MRSERLTPSAPTIAVARGTSEADNKVDESTDWAHFLSGTARGKSAVEYGPDRIIFKQGDPADSVFYIRKGKVKLAATSEQGKEAIVAILNAGEFLGEGCLAGQRLREATATSLTDSALYRIEKSLMARTLHERPEVAELFVAHLISRNIQYEEDLVDQLFNNSEKRLARTLLLLAHFGRNSQAEAVYPKISQEELAQMVGTTRSRVSHFMNKFKKQGFVDYNTGGGLTVHSGLFSVILGPLSKPGLPSGFHSPSEPHSVSESPYQGNQVPLTYEAPLAKASPGEGPNTTLLLSWMRIASSNDCENQLPNDLSAAEEEMWSGRLG